MIETAASGSSAFAERVIKCGREVPDCGRQDTFDRGIRRISANDEVKFVISRRQRFMSSRRNSAARPPSDRAVQLSPFSPVHGRSQTKMERP